jgi:hypothetical protein
MSHKEIVTLLDRQSVVDAINRLGEEDLRMLKGLIVERFNRLAQEKRSRLLGKFYIGDLVQLKNSDGELKRGRVLRVNQKTISIDVGDGSGWWKVSPSLVEQLESGKN